jgi:hypothetical protein
MTFEGEKAVETYIDYSLTQNVLTSVKTTDGENSFLDYYPY